MDKIRYYYILLAFCLNIDEFTNGSAIGTRSFQTARLGSSSSHLTRLTSFQQVRPSNQLRSTSVLSNTPTLQGSRSVSSLPSSSKSSGSLLSTPLLSSTSTLASGTSIKRPTSMSSLTSSKLPLSPSSTNQFKTGSTPSLGPANSWTQSSSLSRPASTSNLLPFLPKPSIGSHSTTNVNSSPIRTKFPILLSPNTVQPISSLNQANSLSSRFHNSNIGLAVTKRCKRSLLKVDENAFWTTTFQALDSHQGITGKPHSYVNQFQRLSNGKARIPFGQISGLGASSYTGALDSVTTQLNTALRHGTPETKKLAREAALLMPKVIQGRIQETADYLNNGGKPDKGQHAHTLGKWNTNWNTLKPLVQVQQPAPATSVFQFRPRSLSLSGLDLPKPSGSHTHGSPITPVGTGNDILSRPRSMSLPNIQFGTEGPTSTGVGMAGTSTSSVNTGINGPLKRKKGCL